MSYANPVPGVDDDDDKIQVTNDPIKEQNRALRKEGILKDPKSVQEEVTLVFKYKNGVPLNPVIELNPEDLLDESERGRPFIVNDIVPVCGSSTFRENPVYIMCPNLNGERVQVNIEYKSPFSESNNDADTQCFKVFAMLHPVSSIQSFTPNLKDKMLINVGLRKDFTKRFLKEFFGKHVYSNLKKEMKLIRQELQQVTPEGYNVWEDENFVNNNSIEGPGTHKLKFFFAGSDNAKKTYQKLLNLYPREAPLKKMTQESVVLLEIDDEKHSEVKDLVKRYFFEKEQTVKIKFEIFCKDEPSCLARKRVDTVSIKVRFHITV